MNTRTNTTPERLSALERAVVDLTRRVDELTDDRKERDIKQDAAIQSLGDKLNDVQVQIAGVSATLAILLRRCRHVDDSPDVAQNKDTITWSWVGPALISSGISTVSVIVVFFILQGLGG